MHVTVSSFTNHISRYICRQGPGFQEMEACSLLVNLRKGMQSSSQQPLVGEEHCVTTLITAAKETTTILESIPLLDSSPHPREHSPLVQPVRRFFNVPQY